jgi:opacity protein-like surface antigen
MRRILVIAFVLCLAVVSTQAQSFKAGPFVGYTFSGDIENEDLAYGAQVIMDLNDTFSIELALSMLSDEASDTETVEDLFTMKVDTELEAAAITLSGRVAFPLADKLKGYAGAGIGYYIYDASADSDIVLGDWAAGTGLSASQDAEVDLDNSIGLQVLAGLEYRVAENIEVFAELRYAIVDVDGEVTATTTITGPGVSESATETGELEDTGFDHALARIGLNYIF